VRRHRALALIGASLIPFAPQAYGQQSVHRVGVLGSTEIPENIEAWLEGLRARGYVVGQNLEVEYRYFRGRYEQIPALLAELVPFGPEVIVTSTSNSAVAIHAAAPTIPMVFLNVADPVDLASSKAWGIRAAT
jgi:putative ABC transport system substrate-binding protein